jgi:hypothetical protein
MTTLEDRLNAAGERFRAAHTALPAVGEPDHAQTRSPLRRWAIPIVTAPVLVAAVLAIAFGLSALVGTHGSRVLPAKPTTTPGPSQVPFTVPAGQQLVSYHGIEILAPAGLPTTTIGCGPPTRSQILLISDIIYNCPYISSFTQAPGLTTISISAIVPPSSPPLPAHDTGGQIAPVGGVGARIGYSQSSSGVSGFLLVPSVHVELDVITPTKAQTEAILLSTRVVAVDQLGCHAQLSHFIPTDNAPASEMLPSQPVSAYLCQYGLGDYYAVYNGWLLRSQRLSPAVISKLVPVINALPLRTRAGRQAVGTHDVLTFHYADGSTRIVDATIYTESDPEIVTDGQHTATVNEALAELLPIF